MKAGFLEQEIDLMFSSEQMGVQGDTNLFEKEMMYANKYEEKENKETEK
jgi:hypothetical protein